MRGLNTVGGIDSMSAFAVRCGAFQNALNRMTVDVKEGTCVATMGTCGNVSILCHRKGSSKYLCDLKYCEISFSHTASRMGPRTASMFPLCDKHFHGM